VSRRDPPAVRQDPLRLATSIFLGALGAEVLVLAATGIALYFVYRPDDARAWNDIRALHGSGSVAFSHGARSVHRLAAFLTFPTAVLAGVLVGLRRDSARRWTGPAVGVALVLAALVTGVTGYLLPWDQLALWAVTVGSNLLGYRALASHQVRFVLIGGVEVSPTTVLRELVIHALLGGPVLALLIACGWRRGGRARSEAAEAAVRAAVEPVRR
jgi:quinol-cytochrome oxidoreductase complex cytochrome b subunit